MVGTSETKPNQSPHLTRSRVLLKVLMKSPSFIAGELLRRYKSLVPSRN